VVHIYWEDPPPHTHTQTHTPSSIRNTILIDVLPLLTLMGFTTFVSIRTFTP
jgi:hypothetical protein